MKFLTEVLSFSVFKSFKVTNEFTILQLHRGGFFNHREKIRVVNKEAISPELNVVDNAYLFLI